MNTKERQLYVLRIENFYKRIGGKILTETITFDAEYRHSVEPVPFSKRLDGKYKKIKEGEKWGNAWDSAWFHIKAEVPKSWKGKEVVAQLDFNSEGLVFTKDGMPVQSITKGSVFQADYSKDIHYLLKSCKGGEKIELWVETAANNLFGIDRTGDPSPTDPKRHGTFNASVNNIRLCVFDRELWAFWLDTEVIKINDKRPSGKQRPQKQADPHNERSHRRFCGYAGECGEMQENTCQGIGQESFKLRFEYECSRARPHRHGMAMACLRRNPQMREDLCKPDNPLGKISELCLRRISGPALCVCKGILSQSLQEDKGDGEARPLGMSGRHVG